jgi:hypothetical protein
LEGVPEGGGRTCPKIPLSPYGFTSRRDGDKLRWWTALLDGVDCTSIFVPLLGGGACKAGVDKIKFTIYNFLNLCYNKNTKYNI